MHSRWRHLESILSVIVCVSILVALVGEPATGPRARTVFFHFPVMFWAWCRVEKYVPSLFCRPFTAATTIGMSVDGPRRLPPRSDWSAVSDLDGSADLAEYYDVVAFFLLAFKRMVLISCGGALCALPLFLGVVGFGFQPDGTALRAAPRRFDAYALVTIFALYPLHRAVSLLEKYCIRPWHAKLVEKCLTQPRCQLLQSSLLGSSLVYAFLLFFPSVPHFSLRGSLAIVHTARVLNVFMGIRGAGRSTGYTGSSST